MSEDNKRISSRYKKIIILVCTLLFPATIYFILTMGKHNMLSLPFYGEREVIRTVVDGKEKTDTVYHQIPDFSFFNQEGRNVSLADFEGKIIITDFFFTTCPGICPKMTANMLHVQQKTKDFEDVVLLSHTVNPEHDTVEVLAEYAKETHANNKRWHFLTGEKEEIYRHALYGYLLNASEDVLAPGGFLHSELIVLVDKNRRIRGYYDGTNLNEVKNLIDAIKVLKAEEFIPRKSKKK
jgi:protein SCO1